MTVQLDTWENRLLTMAYGPLENWVAEHRIDPVEREDMETAYTYCDAITQEHSATFYMASSLLPKEQKALRCPRP